LGVENRQVSKKYDYDIEQSRGNIYKDESPRQISVICQDDFVTQDNFNWLTEIHGSKQLRILFPNGQYCFAVATTNNASSNTKKVYSNFVVELLLPEEFNPFIDELKDPRK